MLGQRRRYIFDLWFDPSAAAAAVIFQSSFYVYLVLLWFLNVVTYDYNELLHPPEGHEQPHYYFWNVVALGHYKIDYRLELVL